MRKKISNICTPEFARYFIVVLIGLGVDIGLLYLLYQVIGIWYLLAAGISFSTALICNYLLSVRFVFTPRGMRHPFSRFTPFAVVGISALMVSQAGMFFGVEVCHLPVIITKCLILPITFMWNFLLQKHFVFLDTRAEIDSKK